jgi:hypothetical protein
MTTRAGQPIVHWRPLAWLLPFLVTVLVALVGWQFASLVQLDIGALTDGRYIEGFYAREQGADGSFRWSGPDAQIMLPAVRAPAVASLHVSGRPGGSVLTLAFNRQPMAELRLPAEPARRVILLLPGSLPASGYVTLQLAAPGAVAPGQDDPRAIVAALSAVGLRSLPGATLPPLLPVLLLGGLAALYYALLRLIGVRLGPALMFAAVLGALLATGWGWTRLWVAPYLVPLTVGLAVITALLGAAGTRVARGDQLDEASVLGVLATFTALIPLYLFVDYGWRSIADPQNLPVLLLPLGLGLLWAPTRWRMPLAAAIVVVSAGYALGKLAAIFSGDYARDFHAMYRGIRWLVTGAGPLYQIDELRQNPLAATYKYPPPFALVLAPLVQLSFVPALVIWRCINLGLLIAAIVLLLRIYRVPLRSWAGAGLLLLVCNLRALTDTLNYGQLDILLLLLIIAGLPALTKFLAARPSLIWGFGLGIGVMFKIYPAYLLGFALLHRRWRALAGAALAAALLLGVSLLAFGPAVHWTFLTQVFATTGAGTGWVENQTFNGLLNRLLVFERLDLVPDGGGPLRLATYVWAAGLTALTAWLTRPGGGMRPGPGYSLWIVSMLLVLPSAWMHYQTLTLIPLFLVFVLARDEPERLTWPGLACAALAWGLLAHGNLWTFFDRSLHGPFWQLILSFKFYGLLLLYSAMVLLFRRWSGEAATTAKKADFVEGFALNTSPGEGLLAESKKGA